MNASYELLGARIDRLTLPDLNGIVRESVVRRDRRLIANHNLHSLYLFHRDPGMRAFYALADHVHVDGMALVLIARLLGLPFDRSHRVTYVDWLDPLLSECAAHGWRVLFVGSAPGVGERAAAILRERHPGLMILTRSGYFDARPGSADSVALQAQINEYAPDVLFVGMGMPRQERWVFENWRRIDFAAVLTCGAAFDYVAGVVPTPPRWAGQLGLEWLFRLVREPRRLGPRYLVEPWFLLGLLARDVVRRRSRRIAPRPTESRRG